MPSSSFEQTNRVIGGHTLNTQAVNQEQAPSSRTSIETALSVHGLVARVIVATGNYVKVDWYRNNKPYTTYKSKNFVQATALSFINAAATADGF